MFTITTAVFAGRRRDRASQSAAEAMLVGEAVPVDARRFEAGRQHSAGPVCLVGYLRPGAGHDAAEGGIIGDLYRQPLRLPGL